jgi:hypothetical protein
MVKSKTTGGNNKPANPVKWVKPDMNGKNIARWAALQALRLLVGRYGSASPLAW